MTIQTYSDLVGLVELGMIYPVDPQHIGPSSVDVHLGETVWTEDARPGEVVDLMAKQNIAMSKITMGSDGFQLRPGQFILAETRESFFLPTDISGEFRLRSSIARNALDQSLAVWCDPGWHGSRLTMELKNISEHHTLLLRPGLRIGQMIFFKGRRVPGAQSYSTRGRYNNDQEATPSKGV